MAFEFVFNGRHYVTPQAVSFIEAVRNAGASLANFGVTLILGRGDKGIPALAHNTSYYTSDESSSSSIKYVPDVAAIYNDSMAVSRDYGIGTDLYYGLNQFQLNGGSSAIIMNVRPNIRTYGVALVDNATPTANTTHTLFSKDFGAATNDIYLNITYTSPDVSIEVTKPERTMYLRTTVAATTQRYVDLDVALGTDIPYAVNDVVHIVDNTHLGSNGKTLTVESVDLANRRVYFVSNALPRIEEIVIGSHTTGQTFKVTINSTTVTYTAISSDTTEDLVAEHFASAINADGTVSPIATAVATGSGGKLRITAKVAGVDFTTFDITTGTPTGTESLTSPAPQANTPHNIGALFATTGYARIFKMDLDDTIEGGGKPTTPTVSSGLLSSDIAITNWFNNDSLGLLGCVTTTGGIPNGTNIGFLGTFTGATKGTRPAMTATIWTDVQTAIKDVVKRFLVRHIIVLDNVDVDNSGTERSNITTWNSTEASLRNGQPSNLCMFWYGCNTGNTFLAAATVDSPEYRASKMNNERFILAEMGLDGLPAYLSMSPQMCGDVVSNKINHNLTRDNIVCSNPEELRTDMEVAVAQRIDGGVLATLSKSTGLKVARGVNTLQDNTNIWTTDSKTHSIMQRQIADYCDTTLRRGIDEDIIGADNLTKSSVQSYVNSTAAKLLNEGVITAYNPAQTIITRVTAGWTIQWFVTPDQETDFVGIITNILVSD